jgi:uncharacterized protein YdbL (DUF1318 family)
MKTFTRLTLILGILFAFSTAQAASKDEQAREKRYAQILELKGKGNVGETYDGYVAVREGDDEKTSKLVDEENADRKTIYEKIAKDTSVTVKDVAERAAKRNFDKAKGGEYLKGKDGKWTKKA